MNHIQNAMTQAAELIRKAYDAAVQAGELPQAEVRPVQIEIPKDLRNGDYASGFAMQNAKVLRQNPRKVAEILVAKMELEGTCFASAEIAGPGFLNLRLSHSWFENVLNNITEEGANYGRTVAEKPEKVMVEFVSANPTGPMHMGNARGGVLGDCLAEVLSRAGNEVTREFYVNDAGNQIDKFATSLDARYRQIILGEEAVEFPENGYHGNDIKVLARKFFEKHGDSYLNRPEKERHEALAAFGLEHNIPAMKADLQRYLINYDVWFFESELHNSDYVADTVKKLTENGYTYEKDGALWLNTSMLLEQMYRKEGKSSEDIEKLEL